MVTPEGFAHEEGLVRQAKDGSQEAFAQLYEKHFDQIYRYIYFRLRQPEAEDLAQDVFIRAYQALPTYDWRGVPFTAWLYRIARNALIDHVRRRKKQASLSLDEVRVSSGDNPELLAERNMEVAELLKAVEKLPDAQREVISLRFGAQYSIAEAARALGKSEGTIKSLQYNAVVSLRKMLKQP
ncbi:MAG: sigma-70 family RNA polymerase sigma factor [Chloroflexota bacterium]